MASALAPDGDQVNEHVEHIEEPPAVLAVPGGEVQHRGGEAQGVSKWPATAAKILKVREKL